MKQMNLNTIMKVKQMMKNHLLAFIVVFFAFAMFFVGAVGCSCNNGPMEPETTEPETVTETAPATTEAQTESEAETETPDTGFRNPLTGEMTETDISANRPYLVMLNTASIALPQRGNTKADILIEMMEEGGVTRVIGLYQSLEGVGQLGSIRSTREYFYSWALAFDGLVAHAGGDAKVRAQIEKDGSLTLNALKNAGGAFYRDKERQSRIPTEHTMFTTGQKLLDMTKHLNFRTTLQEDRSKVTQLHFTEDGTPANGDSAQKVFVKFSGAKTTTFTYNKETKLYDVTFWDNDPYVDEDNNNEQVRVTNIVILPVPNWTKKEGKYIRQKYNLSGGNGTFICGGKATKITWKKGDYLTEGHYADPLYLYDSEGKDLQLGVGKTYICVINETMPYTIE